MQAGSRSRLCTGYALASCGRLRHMRWSFPPAALYVSSSCALRTHFFNPPPTVAVRATRLGFHARTAGAPAPRAPAHRVAWLRLRLCQVGEGAGSVLQRACWAEDGCAHEACSTAPHMHAWCACNKQPHMHRPTLPTPPTLAVSSFGTAAATTRHCWPSLRRCARCGSWGRRQSWRTSGGCWRRRWTAWFQPGAQVCRLGGQYGSGSLKDPCAAACGARCLPPLILEPSSSAVDCRHPRPADHVWGHGAGGAATGLHCCCPEGCRPGEWHCNSSSSRQRRRQRQRQRHLSRRQVGAGHAALPAQDRVPCEVCGRPPVCADFR